MALSKHLRRSGKEANELRSPSSFPVSRLKEILDFPSPPEFHKSPFEFIKCSSSPPFSSFFPLARTRKLLKFQNVKLPAPAPKRGFREEADTLRETRTMDQNEKWSRNKRCSATSKSFHFSRFSIPLPLAYS